MSLSGTGSVFPTSIDSFPLVKDGSGSSCLYSPSTFNKIGDALYNLETHCFTCLQTNTTRYFLTFTASATITEETESIDLSQWFYGVWERTRMPLIYPDQFGYAQDNLIKTLFPGDSALAHSHGEPLSSTPSVFLSVWGNDESGNPVLCEGVFRYQKITHNAYSASRDAAFYAPSFEVGILPVPHTINATGSSLVVNGSFETSGSGVPNWTVTPANSVQVSNVVKSYHGTNAVRWVAASGAMNTTASITVSPGSSYILRFATGCSSGLKTSPTFEWSVVGGSTTVSGSLVNPLLATMNSARWHPFNGSVSPTYEMFKDILPYNHFHVYKSRPMSFGADTSVTINFMATSASGILLDDVRFLPVSTAVDETTGYEPVRNLLPAGTYEFKLTLGFLTPTLVMESYSE